MARAPVCALAVHDYRRGVDNAAYPGLGRGPQHDRGAQVVLPGVVVEIGDVDAESDLRGQVHEDVTSLDGCAHPIEVADVVAPVLRDVEHPHGFAVHDQATPDRRADEPARLR